MKLIIRKELYLNKIVGNNDYETPEKPIPEEEFFFAEILGEAVQAPEPLDNGTNPNTNDFVEKMRFNSMGYTPMLVSSKQGYYGDYFYQNTGTRYLLLGGTSASGVHAGAFCFYLRTASGYTQWDIAAALSCKPLAGKNPTPDSIRSITLPALPVLPGTDTLTVGTEVQPSKVYIKGQKERE